MEKNMLVQLNVVELKDLINESVSTAISNITKPKAEDELLKRKDVAKLFSVSLVTISDWMKTGKLPFHRINSRIFFKKSEVLDAMQSTRKYNRKHK